MPQANLTSVQTVTITMLNGAHTGQVTVTHGLQDCGSCRSHLHRASDQHVSSLHSKQRPHGVDER
jgi:hypothetical protein